MRRLTECPVSPEEPRARPPHRAEIAERKGKKRSRAVPRRLARVEDKRDHGQVLELTSDEPLVAYGFPEEGRHRVELEGKRPDGVVLAELDGRTLAVFIELKATGTAGKAEHGLEQVRAGVMHFAPLYGRREAPTPTHGDEHHEAWAAGDDRPAVDLSDNHEVAGVAVVFRALPRDLSPPAEEIAGKRVHWATVQVPMQGGNQASIEVRKLLTDAQVPGMTEAPRRRPSARRS